MTMEEIGGNQNHLVNFRILYMATQMIGITILILTASWIGIYLDGLGWYSSVQLQFNWHPLLMMSGMIFLYANSILVYRGFRHARKKNLKWTHAILHIVAFVLTVIGLIAVFDSHNLSNPPIPNLYSLHSWIGLIAVILFAMQWLVGFISFLVPGLKDPIKELYMPVHIYFGLLGFGFAVAAVLIGLSEKSFFSIKNIADLPSQAVLVNSIGILVIVFASLVVYLTTEKSYKRLALPEDQMLLTQHAE